MGTVWFSSDTHFLHAMVAGLRGFTSSAEHDEAVIYRWNQTVRPDDLVWHLGDVGLGNETRVLEQAARLNGRKQLVSGNHDPCWPGHRDSRKRQRYWLDVFESVHGIEPPLGHSGRQRRRQGSARDTHPPGAGR
jgi:calcineurin-like phosphoesterase family protein